MEGWIKHWSIGIPICHFIAIFIGKNDSISFPLGLCPMKSFSFSCLRHWHSYFGSICHYIEIYLVSFDSRSSGLIRNCTQLFLCAFDFHMADYGTAQPSWCITSVSLIKSLPRYQHILCWLCFSGGQLTHFTWSSAYWSIYYNPSHANKNLQSSLWL